MARSSRAGEIFKIVADSHAEGVYPSIREVSKRLRGSHVNVPALTLQQKNARRLAMEQLGIACKPPLFIKTRPNPGNAD